MPQPSSLIPLLLTLLTLAACHPGRPNSVIGESKMERILYDYHIAQAMADLERDSADYHRYAYVQKVFQKHGVTEADFDSSMVWYSAHSKELLNIYTRLKERLDAEVAQAEVMTGNDIYASLTADGDTANIWAGERMLVLLQESQQNSQNFAYKADSTFLPGDEYILRLRTFFLQRDGAQNAVIALTAHYEGDSTATIRPDSVCGASRTIRGDGDHELRLRTDDSLRINSVSGFIYYPTTDNRDGSPRRLFIMNPMLIRIHNEKNSLSSNKAD